MENGLCICNAWMRAINLLRGKERSCTVERCSYGIFGGVGGADLASDYTDAPISHL